MGQGKTIKRLISGILSLAFFVLPLSGLAAPAAPAQKYLVKFKSSNSDRLRPLGDNINRQFTFSGNPAFQNIYSFSSRYSLAQLRADLWGVADYVEADNAFAPAATNYYEQMVTANDPGFTANTMNVDKQWAIPAAGFDFAWDKTTGSINNIVALIDTGVDATHEDLKNIRMVGGYDFINNQPIVGQTNSDDNGHGTLVAGVLGASANNGLGVVGTNWAISIMPIKALDSTGKGDSSSVAQAIVWAADHGANFINLSLGGVGFGHDSTLSNAITYAFNKGILIVAAAGNDSATSGDNLDQTPVYPVCDDNGANMVLGAAALDQNGLKPDFSDYGANCIDVSAPGKRILSTINHDPITKVYSPNSYAYASGTSLAAPFVVGEAALIKTLNPNATNTQIRDQILSTAVSVDNLNLSQCAGQSCRGLLGAGEINAQAAVNQAIPQTVIKDGDLVTSAPNQPVYQIIGNQKRPVSQFVLQQKFSAVTPKLLSPSQISGYSDGPYVAPNDGTLVKTASDQTVYMTQQGQKLPVTYQIFQQRKLSFAGVVTLSDSEINSWLTASLLPPSEGTLVRTVRGPAIYWVVNGTLHLLNYNFYSQRGLNIFPILYVSAKDLAGFPQGDAYVR